MVSTPTTELMSARATALPYGHSPGLLAGAGSARQGVPEALSLKPLDMIGLAAMEHAILARCNGFLPSEGFTEPCCAPEAASSRNLLHQNPVTVHPDERLGQLYPVVLTALGEARAETRTEEA